jgi:SAM-dependent methyltransferase
MAGENTAYPAVAVCPVLEVDPDLDAGSKRRATSSGSSVLDDSSIEEHGRTYHAYKQGAYLLPNDAEEQNRLDIQHKTITTLLGGRLALAPIEPRNVLDVATGTGIWAIELAKQYPKANVIGSDLSLIQPTHAVDNCSFIKEDAENDEWTYNQRFDFIHFRLIYTCFNDLAAILKKTYDHLESGGWVEFQDQTPEIKSFDGSSVGSGMEKFGQTIVSGLTRIGRDATRIKTLRQLLVAQGFVDVTERIMPYPIGAWPRDPHYKEVGRWMGHNVGLGLEGSIKMLFAAGLSEWEANDLISRVRGELKNHHVHAFVPFHVVYGRKP